MSCYVYFLYLQKGDKGIHGLFTFVLIVRTILLTILTKSVNLIDKLRI